MEEHEIELNGAEGPSKWISKTSESDRGYLYMETQASPVNTRNPHLRRGPYNTQHSEACRSHKMASDMSRHRGDVMYSKSCTGWRKRIYDEVSDNPSDHDKGRTRTIRIGGKP